MHACARDFEIFTNRYIYVSCSHPTVEQREYSGGFEVRVLYMCFRVRYLLRRHQWCHCGSGQTIGDVHCRSFGQNNACNRCTDVSVFAHNHPARAHNLALSSRMRSDKPERRKLPVSQDTSFSHSLHGRRGSCAADASAIMRSSHPTP